MENREYRTVDKSEWPRGEWDSEPDKAQFVDENTGLPCLIVRGPSGALCGYVGVAEGHPLFNRDCFDATADQIEVHGGLTFSDFCAHSADESRHICHVPAPGEPDRVWWFGFDCAHSGDLCPAFGNRPGFERSPWENYCGIGYLRNQCAKLAEQLVALV